MYHENLENLYFMCKNKNYICFCRALTMSNLSRWNGYPWNKDVKKNKAEDFTMLPIRIIQWLYLIFFADKLNLWCRKWWFVTLKKDKNLRRNNYYYLQSTHHRLISLFMRRIIDFEFHLNSIVLILFQSKGWISVSFILTEKCIKEKKL